MGLSGKLFFFLVAIVAFEAVSAWPLFNPFKWRNVEYDLYRTVDDAERDVKKDLLNSKNKMWKDATKVLKKSASETATNCVMEAHQEYLGALDQASVIAVQCLEEMKQVIADAEIDENNNNVRELVMLKNSLKSRIKDCRNTAKNEFKFNVNQFSRTAKECAIR